MLITPQYGSELVGTSTNLINIGYAYISKETLFYVLTISLKYAVLMPITVIFIFTTHPSEFASSLNKIGIPYKIAYAVNIAFRYIPDISRDYENISISMQCRGLELDKKKASPFERLKQTVMILIPLVITSFDRVNDIANAMDLRGFGKHKKRTYYAEHEIIKGEKIFIAFYLIVFAFVIFYSIYSRVVTFPTKMWIYW